MTQEPGLVASAHGHSQPRQCHRSCDAHSAHQRLAVRVATSRAQRITQDDDVYSMRMARVNITVPDDVIAEARRAGLNVSRLAASALVEELDRRAKIQGLDTYLAELEAELGPSSAEELNEAQQWADRVLAPPSARAPRRRRPA